METMVNTAFQHTFCRHVRVVEIVCFCLTLIKIHHCLYNCYCSMTDGNGSYH